VPELRSAIERLASGSANVEAYDIAIAAFVKQREISSPKHPGRKALDRLMRFYIRHFRRELVIEQRYLEAAARRALMASGCPVICTALHRSNMGCRRRLSRYGPATN
jgi:hypothetical protein